MESGNGGLKSDGGCWVGQGSKATLLLEISRKKEYTSSLGFAFFIRDWLFRKFTLITNSVCPVSTDCRWSLGKST